MAYKDEQEELNQQQPTDWANVYNETQAPKPYTGNPLANAEPADNEDEDEDRVDNSGPSPSAQEIQDFLNPKEEELKPVTAPEPEPVQREEVAPVITEQQAPEVTPVVAEQQAVVPEPQQEQRSEKPEEPQPVITVPQDNSRANDQFRKDVTRETEDETEMYTGEQRKGTRKTLGTYPAGTMQYLQDNDLPVEWLSTPAGREYLASLNAPAPELEAGVNAFADAAIRNSSTPQTPQRTANDFLGALGNFRGNPLNTLPEVQGGPAAAAPQAPQGNGYVPTDYLRNNPVSSDMVFPEDYGGTTIPGMPAPSLPVTQEEAAAEPAPERPAPGEPVDLPLSGNPWSPLSIPQLDLTVEEPAPSDPEAIIGSYEAAVRERDRENLTPAEPAVGNYWDALTTEPAGPAEAEPAGPQATPEQPAAPAQETAQPETPAAGTPQPEPNPIAQQEEAAPVTTLADQLDSIMEGEGTPVPEAVAPNPFESSVRDADTMREEQRAMRGQRGDNPIAWNLQPTADTFNYIDAKNGLYPVEDTIPAFVYDAQGNEILNPALDMLLNDKEVVMAPVLDSNGDPLIDPLTGQVIMEPKERLTYTGYKALGLYWQTGGDGWEGMTIPEELRKVLASTPRNGDVNAFGYEGKTPERFQGSVAQYNYMVDKFLEANPSIQKLIDNGNVTKEEVVTYFFKAPPVANKPKNTSSGKKNYSSGGGGHGGGGGGGGGGGKSSSPQELKPITVNAPTPQRNTVTPAIASQRSAVQQQAASQRMNRVYNIMKNWSF